MIFASICMTPVFIKGMVTKDCLGVKLGFLLRFYILVMLLLTLRICVSMLLFALFLSVWTHVSILISIGVAIIIYKTNSEL